jgi:ubiquinone/menaquinone biosynthesis C-methylase UbiE
MMEEVLEYTILAKYYDLFFSKTKDYKVEALGIKKLVDKYKQTNGKELLDVACGTGRHIQHLRKWYHCTGTDLNEDMLKLARKNAKGISFKQADMLKLRMDMKFDVVTCLFSAIGYLQTYENLDKAIKNFSRLTKKGGVLVIDGWFNKETWKDGYTLVQLKDFGKIKIVKASYSWSKGMTSIFQTHWIITVDGKGIKHVLDTQKLALYEKNRFLKIMENNGFMAKAIKGPLIGRYRYIGVRS